MASPNTNGTDLTHAFGPRRLHLAALDEAVRSRPELACGIVVRDGVPVLSVVRTGNPSQLVEIGCEEVGEAWYYTWAACGDRLGPVGDAPTAVATLADYLSAHAGRSRGR